MKKIERMTEKDGRNNERKGKIENYRNTDLQNVRQRRRKTE